MKENLDDYTDEDLRRELDRRAATEAERIRVIREKRMARLAGYLGTPEGRELLMMLTPDHSRSTCRDDDVCNAGRCTRCTVLQALEEEDWGTLLEMRVVA